jgi:hypothetical protein
MLRLFRQPQVTECVKHAIIREAVGHWISLLRDGTPPERRDLDPARMMNALPFVWLCQKHDSHRYRVRLAGAEINQLLQAPLRDRMLDDVLTEPEWHDLEAKFDQVLGIPAFVWSEGAIFESAPHGPIGECAMMPVKERGQLVIVFGATISGAEYVRSRGRLHAFPAKATHVIPLRDL